MNSGSAIICVHQLGSAQTKKCVDQLDETVTELRKRLIQLTRLNQLATPSPVGPTCAASQAEIDPPETNFQWSRDFSKNIQGLNVSAMHRIE